MLRTLVGLGPSPASGGAVCVHSLQQLSGNTWYLPVATLILSPWARLAHRGFTSGYVQADMPCDSRFPQSQPLITERED